MDAAINPIQSFMMELHSPLLLVYPILTMDIT